MAAQPGVRFGLISGDLTENGSVDQLQRFQREMRTLPFPCFATLGNHDLGGGDDLFQRYYGRASFSFPFRGVRFTLIDSASATVAPRVYGWLDDWMDLAEDRLHLVVMHIPPLDPTGLRNGAFASRAEAMKLVSRMARGGVDLNVYGHVHSFYAFRNAGIDAFISGGGGAIPERFDGIGRHYLLMEADPVEQRFRASVVRVNPAD
jgi:3',5'-cyclic AMP phosphodiesterase CpdA